jgi:hypothetical protein
VKPREEEEEESKFKVSLSLTEFHTMKMYAFLN